MQEHLKEGPGFRSFIDLLCVCVCARPVWRSQKLKMCGGWADISTGGPICWAPVDGSVAWWEPFVISSAAGSVRGLWMGYRDMSSLSRVQTGTRSKQAITGWSVPGRTTLPCHCHCQKSSAPPSTKEEKGGKDKSQTKSENKVAEVSGLGDYSNKSILDYLKSWKMQL